MWFSYFLTFTSLLQFDMSYTNSFCLEYTIILRIPIILYEL